MYYIVFESPSIDQYLPLYFETGWNDVLKLDKEEMQKALDGSFVCLSVYDADELVGFGRINSDGIIYAGLFDVMVKSSHRNRGIGTKIVENLVQYCQKHKIRSIHIFSAPGKHEFYEKRGFEVKEEDTPGMKYIGDY